MNGGGASAGNQMPDADEDGMCACLYVFKCLRVCYVAGIVAREDNNTMNSIHAHIYCGLTEHVLEFASASTPRHEHGRPQCVTRGGQPPVKQAA